MTIRDKLIAAGIIIPAVKEDLVVKTQPTLAPMSTQAVPKRAPKRIAKAMDRDRVVAERKAKVEAEAKSWANDARKAWSEARAKDPKPAQVRVQKETPTQYRQRHMMLGQIKEPVRPKITKEQEQALRAIMEERERAERHRKLSGWTDTTTNGDAWRDGRFEYGNR